MDVEHIAAYLNSVGEPEMAQEVLSMHFRLEAFVSGLDRSALQAAIKAGEELSAENARLKDALKPVAWVHHEKVCGECIVKKAVLAKEGLDLPDGTTLYALPPNVE